MLSAGQSAWCNVTGCNVEVVRVQMRTNESSLWIVVRACFVPFALGLGGAASAVCATRSEHVILRPRFGFRGMRTDSITQAAREPRHRIVPCVSYSEQCSFGDLRCSRCPLILSNCKPACAASALPGPRVTDAMVARAVAL